MNRPSTDFQAFLDEIGVSQQQMDAAALAMLTPVDVASDPGHRVRPSPIEGLGVFSSGQFKPGSRVCTLRVGDQWTVTGRYINHDPAPNLVALVAGELLIGAAARNISNGEELTLNYRQVRKAMAGRP